MADIDNYIVEKIKNIPKNPGVYRFLDKENKLLYVGKAKNLKKRVQSYFQKEHENYRLKLLVNKIAEIEYIIVNSEQDALLLENNLIKELQPKYNIQLKDDKTFPWICIKNERFPRVFVTRNRIEDKSEYFGPYTSAYMIKTLLGLIKNIYQLRSCNYILDEENIKSGKYRRCIEYQIGNCKGPCENLQSAEDYNLTIESIKKILKGNINEVIIYLNDLMSEVARQYKFEEANLLKQKLDILQKFQSKSTIVSPAIRNIDVFSLLNEEKYAVVNYMKVVDGAIVQSHTIEIIKKLDEPEEEIMAFAITDIKQKIQSVAKEIIVSVLPADIDLQNIVVPKIGDKKKLLDLSLRNARQYKIEKERSVQSLQEKSPVVRILEKIKEDLRLKKQPNYIECFDNSNLQGTNPVSSCVVLRNAKPSKKEYRHFNVKTVEGADDFASMREIIARRYKRLLDEESQLPDLVIVDGGKGQLSAAYEIFKKLKIDDRVPLIGIAKRLEEIFYPNDPVPLYLNKNSETLKVIQNARNEAHRFGIAHHRGKRSKQMLGSGLDNIAGIGEKTKELLLKKYHTISKIKSVDKAELEKLIGKKKTEILLGKL